MARLFEGDVEAVKRRRRNPAGFFDSPESVSDQKARQVREEAAAKKKGQREEIEARAKRGLSGSRGSIGQGDMFGGGDLFSNPMKKSRKVTKSRKVRKVRRVRKAKRTAPKAKPTLKVRTKVVRSVEKLKTNPHRRKRRKIRRIVKRAPRVIRRNRRTRKTTAGRFYGINAGSKVMLCRAQGSKLKKMGTFTRKALKGWCKRHNVKCG